MELLSSLLALSSVERLSPPSPPSPSLRLFGEALVERLEPTFSTRPLPPSSATSSAPSLSPMATDFEDEDDDEAEEAGDDGAVLLLLSLPLLATFALEEEGEEEVAVLPPPLSSSPPSPPSPPGRPMTAEDRVSTTIVSVIV